MNKKISKIILLLTLLFLLIGIVSATSVYNDTSTHDNTEKVAHGTPNTLKTVESSEQVIEKKTIKKENKNKTVKTASKTYDVTDFNTLQSALTTNQYNEVNINIKSDINLLNKLYVRTSIENLNINGNGKIINGNNKHQFLDISERYSTDFCTVNIKNIKIKNCFTEEYGGAIYQSYYSNLTIINSSISNNIAKNNDKSTYGGAIYSEGTLTIINSSLTNNKANEPPKEDKTYYGGYGGAIYSKNHKITIINSNFTNNIAGVDGGALYIYDNKFELNNNIFKNNSATSGGAIYNEKSYDGNISKTDFINNQAGNSGGAISNYGSLDISNSKFSNNIAIFEGGAIHNVKNIDIIDSVFLNNSVKERWGGAIYNAGNLYTKNSEFSNNIANYDGGAIYIDYDSDNFISNNIFKQNQKISKNTGAITSEENLINREYFYTYNNTNEKTSTYPSTIYNNGGKASIINNIFDDGIKNVEITLNPIKGIIGETITLKATLKDTENIAVTGGNLAFKLNGKTLRSDGRFDSKASAMKFSVKNGLVTYTIKADLYLRNAKNLTASYSGTSNYYETTSPSVTAQIQKRNAQITVTTTPNKAKQYETLTFTIKVKDITKNGKNNTLIYDNTKVMLKVNGVTLKDNNGKTLYITLDKNAQAIYKYTIPAGTGGITASKAQRNYKVDAIFVGDNYYPGARNTTTFQVERSPTTVIITQTTVTKTNVLNVKATLKDYKGNNLIGTNKVTIKINGKSYTKNGKPVYWSVKNGNVDLTGIQVDPKTTIKRVLLVTGERQAYLEGRAETYHIIRT